MNDELASYLLSLKSPKPPWWNLWRRRKVKLSRRHKLMREGVTPDGKPYKIYGIPIEPKRPRRAR